LYILPFLAYRIPGDTPYSGSNRCLLHDPNFRDSRTQVVCEYCLGTRFACRGWESGNSKSQMVCGTPACLSYHGRHTRWVPYSEEWMKTAKPLRLVKTPEEKQAASERLWGTPHRFARNSSLTHNLRARCYFPECKKRTVFCCTHSVCSTTWLSRYHKYAGVYAVPGPSPDDGQTSAGNG
jgi:hypothetical protein